jgi:hypothetical protein
MTPSRVRQPLYYGTKTLSIGPKVLGRHDATRIAPPIVIEWALVASRGTPVYPTISVRGAKLRGRETFTLPMVASAVSGTL